MRNRFFFQPVLVEPEDNSNGDFFDRDRGILIKEYVRSTCELSTTEIRGRELQCVRGSQAISAAFREERKSGGQFF